MFIQRFVLETRTGKRINLFFTGMNTPQDNSGFQNEDATTYERVGGHQFFVELVERFYEFVEADLSLRSLYPEDLEPGKAHLAAFLSQYWGGPHRYFLERLSLIHI